MLDADKVVVDLEIREIEAGDQAERVDGGLEPPLEIGEKLLKRVFPGRAVEATHGHVDRVDRPASEHLEQLVADLLHPQALLDYVSMIGGQADAAFVAQEIGGMQQVDVQRMALDPFGAVKEPSELADLERDGHPECLLEGVAGAHLIGHRADAADPGGDVGNLADLAALEERLEEAGRFEDVELHVLDLRRRQASRKEPLLPRPATGP